MNAPFIWQGRIDAEEVGASTRWHQHVAPFDAASHGGVVGTRKKRSRPRYIVPTTTVTYCGNRLRRRQNTATAIAYGAMKNDQCIPTAKRSRNETLLASK